MTGPSEEEEREFVREKGVSEVGYGVASASKKNYRPSTTTDVAGHWRILSSSIID